jgi:hypothetical protein
VRRFAHVAFLALGLAGVLAAQGRSGIGAAPGGDARMGAGGIRSGPGNILYPGSPRGGQPGSILTPGTPRSPAASNLPGTPGASIDDGSNRVYRDGRFRRGRNFGGRNGGFGRGFVFGQGFGYGGGFGFDGDYDPGDSEVERENEREVEGRGGDNPQPRNSYVVSFPGSGAQKSPTPRVYDVRETPDGRVEMTPVGGSESTAPPPAAPGDYWLVALKGGLIYAVDRYERRDDTLRFRTLEDKQFVVPLAEVDLAFTGKLNSDLGRHFDLR